MKWANAAQVPGIVYPLARARFWNQFQCAVDQSRRGRRNMHEEKRKRRENSIKIRSNKEPRKKTFISEAPIKKKTSKRFHVNEERRVKETH